MGENKQSLDQFVENVYKPPKEEFAFRESDHQYSEYQYYDNLIKTRDATVAGSIVGVVFGLISTAVLVEGYLDMYVNCSYWTSLEVAATVISGALGGLFGYVAASPSS